MRNPALPTTENHQHALSEDDSASFHIKLILVINRDIQTPRYDNRVSGVSTSIRNDFILCIVRQPRIIAHVLQKRISTSKISIEN